MGKVTDLPPGRSLEKRIMARRIAVFNDGGRLYGIESDCKHMRASLANGDVADGVVTCRWHGWKYDLETGECLTNDGFRLKRYDVTVIGDDIILET
ncbi:MAG: Rieske (2Fe-2S) protein [candidate division Zixibacteria bacterium]|nr:Rieske (2Fe-2S) protein [candidate division Zixibacteria bacterium]